MPKAILFIVGCVALFGGIFWGLQTGWDIKPIIVIVGAVIAILGTAFIPYEKLFRTDIDKKDNQFD